MAWSDDMRCLFCDGKLPLYRKITSGQFCSAGHRRAYWKEQERLAVERLSQTHDSLRAYRPAEAEKILGKAPAANPFYLDGQNLREDAVLDFARAASNRDEVVLAGLLGYPRPVASDWSCFPFLSTPEPLSFAASEPEIPATSGATLDSLPAFLFGAPVAGTVDLASTTAPAAMERNRPAVEPLMPASAPVSSFVDLGIMPETPDVLLTPIVEIAEVPAMKQSAVVEEAAIAEEPAAAAIPAVVVQDVVGQEVVAEEVVAQPVVAQEVVAEEVVAQPVFAEEVLAPPMAAAVSLEKFSAASFEFQLGGTEAAPIENTIPAPALVALEKAAVSRVLASAKMLALVAPRTSASASAPAQSSVEALYAPAAQLALELVPPSGLSTRAVVPQLPLGNAVRYPLRSTGTTPLKAAIAPSEIAPGATAIPELCLNSAAPMHEPDSAWLLRLPVKQGTPAAPDAPRAFTASLLPVFENGAEPNLPSYRFEPVDGSVVPPPPRSFLAFANWTPGDPSERRNAWEHVSDFWNHAPRDLKLLVFAIPVLLGLALHPRLPKVHVTAPSGSAGLEKNFEQAFTDRLNVVQQNVASRAGVALAEDFRSGLEDWQTRGDLSAAWSFDANGFVRPGSLALYRPSMRLADYDLQFLGLIDKKALSFVARAQDFDNYYVIKLVLTKPGPLPTIGVTRYAVVNGKAQSRVDSVAPITAMPDMLYRVDLNVHDDTYLLTLQGKVVDTWSEPRLTHGGVGFFAPRGEESRVRWVQLTHQYDMLGRLCAYLAPYNTPTTNGSW